MKKNAIHLIIVLFTIVATGLGFEKIVQAEEIHDTDEQSITFTLVEGKEIPNDSSSIVKKPSGGRFPSTGEASQSTIFVGIALLLIAVIIRLLRTRKGRIE